MKIIQKLIITIILIMQNEQILCEEQTKKNIVLAGFGSPIVDGVFEYSSDPQLGEEIKKKLNYHMSSDFPIEFYQEVLRNQKTSIYLGGSAMNTIRLTNHLLTLTKNFTIDQVSFIGSIGDDSLGDLIINSLKSEGVVFEYQRFENTRTSTCIVLVESIERSFFSDLGSSEKVTVDHFRAITDQLKKSKIFYADAYLIGKRFDCYEYTYSNLANESTLLALSMASENIVRDFHENLNSIFPFIDILFINTEELNTWRNNFNLANLSPREFILHISKIYEKSNKSKRRIIINTRGKDDTLIYVRDYVNDEENFLEVPIHFVDQKSIVDLNGAGDSFSAGFLTGILNGHNVVSSAKLGNRIAAEVIQLKGFQIPKNIELNSILESDVKIDL
jgi:sugar/nucleoside kinase (ribokinase family)